MLRLGASLGQSLQKYWKVIQKQIASNFGVWRRILHTTVYWLNTTLPGKKQVRALPDKCEKVGKRWIVYALITVVSGISAKNKADSWWIDAERMGE